MIQRMVQQSPEQQYQSMGEVREHLAILQGDRERLGGVDRDSKFRFSPEF